MKSVCLVFGYGIIGRGKKFVQKGLKCAVFVWKRGSHNVSCAKFLGFFGFFCYFGREEVSNSVGSRSKSS